MTDRLERAREMPGIFLPEIADGLPARRIVRLVPDIDVRSTNCLMSVMSFSFMARR